MTVPNPFDSRSPEVGVSGQEPEGSTPLVRAGSTPPATSNVEHAVTALGDLLNLAFRDALRVDQLARQTVTAFGALDHDQRIDLGDRHPRLLENLLLLEDAYDRIDRR